MASVRICLATALVLTATTVAAQQNRPTREPDENTAPSTATESGQIEGGFRGTTYSDGSDEARYQRYRDLRDGAFGENIRWRRDDEHAFWDVRATHVGYRDQQYAANYNRFGKVRFSFEWNQIPLFFSDSTRTPYVETY